MFETWKHDQNVEHVAVACGVRPETVRRYRALDRWEDRVRLEAAALGKPSEESLAAAKAIILGDLNGAAALGLSAIAGRGFTKAIDGWKVYREATEMKLRLLGDTAPTEKAILALAGAKLAELDRRRKEREQRATVQEIPCQVVTESESGKKLVPNSNDDNRVNRLYIMRQNEEETGEGAQSQGVDDKPPSSASADSGLSGSGDLSPCEDVAERLAASKILPPPGTRG